ncbi:conserved hypothetical protein [Ricinus communis]|uniref:Protein FLX-like 4 n=1 Tax=Ricinus communis TaxID=3988 RepID=B9SQE8_RICCO|nr:conserved hypothetical protein [Ricinus communis]|eukprot:XP_002528217.1 protein FLX-like 4 [Ricinus communis]
MAGKGHNPPGLEGRYLRRPESIRHGLFPPSHRQLDRLPPSDLLENKIAAQAAEIEQLAGDNHRLAATHMALRQDLVDAQQEVKRRKAHIRSIQTESDIQMRMLLDKIAKMEAEIRLGDNVKKELRQAHMEAQSLVKAGQDLTTQIQEASKELQKVRTDVSIIPDLQAELENLRHEYKRLRAMFEYEKGLNIEKVERLQAMEQNLIRMARELEKLHAGVLNAEKKAHAPNLYGGGYVTRNPSCSFPIQRGAASVDSYGRHLVHTRVGPAVNGTIPYDNGNNAAIICGIGGSAVSSAGGVAPLGGSCDPSLAEK